MSTGTLAKSFKDSAKKYKAKSASVLALKHEGPPKQYPTEHGTETAEDGDYVVQVGEVELTETIPPDKAKGIPGGMQKHKVPLLEVMKAADFLALYED